MAPIGDFPNMGIIPQRAIFVKSFFRIRRYEIFVRFRLTVTVSVWRSTDYQKFLMDTIESEDIWMFRLLFFLQNYGILVRSKAMRESDDSEVEKYCK